MRRDSLFYKLFQQYPALLFQLLTNPPENASEYRFDSVAVKEPRFEIDGMFLPPENESSGVVYFCEVQFQKDEQLYERVFAESSLYFYRNRDRFSDWQAVIIYPSRSIEQSNLYPHRSFLNGGQVHRVYLDEIGDIRQLPLESVMLLTTVDESQAPEEARYLLQRTQRETPESSTQDIIELIRTIVAYRFEQLSRREVEAMLGITFEETRFYQDIKQEGREEGREQEERSLVLRLLTKRVGELPQDVRSEARNAKHCQSSKTTIWANALSEGLSHLETLSLDRPENLSEALLDFNSLEDLQSWLGDSKDSL